MADRSRDFQYSFKGIAKVISQERLQVPPNQRDYAWEDSQVSQIFQDIYDALNADKPYFLGTIVLTEGANATFEVSDGQQRLATVLILIAAIRDYFHLTGEKMQVERLENTYISAIDPITEDRVGRLVMNSADREFFRRRVIALPDAPTRTNQLTDVKSNIRIANAAEYARKWVEELVAPHAEKTRKARLLELMTYLDESAEVIVFKVDSDKDAFTMFETLNDRGLKVSQVDLLKNHLFRQVSPDIGLAQAAWASMLSALETVEDDDIVVDFVRHLLINLRGPTREKEMFDHIRQEYRTSSRASQLLDEMSAASSDYAAILTPTHAKWKDYPQSVRKHIATIEYLRVIQIRPLMLAVARHFTPEEAAKAFRLFVSWTVRFLTAGGRGGRLEEAYASTAHQVAKKKIKTAAQLAVAMTPVVPTDFEFQDRFSTARVSKSFLARYYLRALERHIRDEAEPEMVPNDELVITIEHVLPENPTPEHWPDVDPQTAEAVFRMLGNMVLLQASVNSVIGNNSFAMKKPSLAASSYVTTKDVAKCKKWGLDQIRERQEKLARHAVKLWSITA